MIMRARWVSLAILGMVGFAASPLVIRLQPCRRLSRALSSSPAMDAGVDQSWKESVCAALEAREYHASVAVDGQLQAPNRAHNLRTRFGERGIEVVPRQDSPGWQFGWEMRSWGRPGRMEAAGRATPTADGSRVTYERPGLVEWYTNSARGVEQGFTVDRSPAGDGALTIEGQVRGGLRAELRDNAVDFVDAHGANVLRYTELYVWDARGRELASRLETANDRLAILVEDQGATYPLTIDPLLLNPAWTAESDQANAQLGFSVATAGDVNGDSYSDVVVAASMFDSGEADEGRIAVYHGSPSGLAAGVAIILDGNQIGAQFGFCVATAGDVNRDGYSDLVVGTPFFDDVQADEGRAFVFHGSATGITASAAWSVQVNQNGAGFGRSVASAGDVNDDGYSDVIVGAPFFDNGELNEGRAYLYHGSPAGLSTTAAWTGESNQGVADFGYAVGTAGDVNGDRYDDVVVGAPFWDGGVQMNEGRAFVYHGSAAGLSATAAWFTEGNQSSAEYGNAVGTAGDVNGDGFADVIVGAHFYDNGHTNEGRAFVYLGSGTGLSTTTAWTSEADQNVAEHGTAVGSAGDVNGDGYADVIVGARAFTNGQTSEGRASVYQGSQSGLALLPGGQPRVTRPRPSSAGRWEARAM